MTLLASVTPFTSSSTTGNGGSITLPSGTNRKILVGFTKETSATVGALTFDGTSLLANLAVSVESVANAANGSAVYWYDVPDAKGSGSYNLLWDQSVSNTLRRAYVAVLTDAATGAPGWDDATFLDGDGTAVSVTLTSVSAGAFVFALGQCSSSSRTYVWTSPLVERYDETIGGAYQSTQADYDDATSGNVTVTSTISSTGATNRTTLAAVAVASATPSAPVITVQPVAQTKVLTNANTATFGITATGTGGLTYDWELENGVGSGVYADVADGNGATWTGRTTTSLVGTFTAKTLSGRRVRCNVTDSNGTTTSTAVALTLFDGPQVTTFPATNGSGVSTATLTSDYVTGVGEAIEVRIPLSDGDVAVTVTTT
jgi:hypothetical protein